MQKHTHLLMAAALLGALPMGAALAAPIVIGKDRAVAPPRNDVGSGICATIAHVADPMAAAPFQSLETAEKVLATSTGQTVDGLSVDGKVSRAFRDINFRNAQPGAIGDFTGMGTDESFFPFSASADAMPRGNDRNFAARARGYLNIRKAGVATIALNADDGAALSIAGVRIVEANDDISPRVARQVDFRGPGLYPVEFVYYQNNSVATLEVSQADSAAPEGNLLELDKLRFQQWTAARLYSARQGASATCSECGAAGSCMPGMGCVDGLCNACNVPDACGATCEKCPADKRACRGGTCAQCAGDEDCRGGLVCDASGTCVKGTSCTKDTECQAGSVCDPDKQVCVTTRPCTSDQMCPDGRTCDTKRMQCGGYSCRSTDDCPGSQVCDPDRGTCVAPCGSTADCSGNQVCDATSKRCVSTCAGDADCAAGQFCESARCVPRCQGDADCRTGQKCDTQRQRCAATCGAAVGDCPTGQRCDLTRGLCIGTGGDTGKERYVGGCSAAGPAGAAGTAEWLGGIAFLGMAGLMMRRRRRRPRGAAALSTMALTALVFFSVAGGEARAQISANTQLFRPAIGPENIISVEGTRTPGRMTPIALGLLEFSLRPLRLLDASGNTLANTVNSVTTLHLAGGLGILRWLAVGAHLPLVIYQDFDRNTPMADVPQGSEPSAFGIGDLRLWGKLRIINNSESGIGLAWVPQVMFPTGQALRTGGSFDIELLRVAADYRFAGGAVIALNLGFLFRTSEQQVRDVLVSHQVRYGLGAFIPVWKTLGVLAELNGGTSMLRKSLMDATSGPVYSQLEGHVGARWVHHSGLTVMGGLGTNFTDAVGSPQFRIFGGVGYMPFNERRPRGEDPDPDHDGLVGPADACPLEAGPPENLGCPDRDSDQDGIVDRLDRCPNQSGPKENLGCPLEDTDRDGILDKDDKCPQEPGPAETQGCPDKDTDKDTVVDRLDKCPFDPGPAPEGCPKRQFIAVKEDKIDLLQKVYFATNKAVITKGSYPLLDEVVDLLKKRASMELRIEGHTDSTGPRKRNVELSKERANSVRDYLVKGGVESSRLTAEGYGPDKPVADNKTPAGRDKNRRTEFVILKQ